ncbi:hypothetical protein GCM10007363_06980 [Pseudomonas fluvialis]|uniref:Uncharacterized protein n=1 Tax=Pseudomonas fluvialis TaxID=1793966 RepID=A0ABQ2ADY2_9PSED|nr:hypothetical protein GCM10007363_06980 [Pseudomonas fluvialis]
MARAKEKSATSDYRALDVRGLHKAGVLSSGYACAWQWKLRGEMVASIDIHTESRTGVRLRYQVKAGGKAEQKDYRVPIAWTPCHLGGSVRGFCARAAIVAWPSCTAVPCSPVVTAGA